jgi:hypothetical protein
MTSDEDLLPVGPQTWIDRAVRTIAGPDRDPSVSLRRDPEYIVPQDQRKAAMKGLDAVEVKWTVLGLLILAVVPVAVFVYIASVHKTVKNGKTTLPVAPDALLLAGAALIFCVVGLIALRLRKRTLVAFMCMLGGLALTSYVLPLGLGLVVLGGWLMLRASRINRYGTANSKAVARQTSTRSSGRGGTGASSKSERSSTRSSKGSGKAAAGQRAPTANKRYTPKSPPRKKIPKATE